MRGPRTMSIKALGRRRFTRGIGTRYCKRFQFERVHHMTNQKSSQRRSSRKANRNSSMRCLLESLESRVLLTALIDIGSLNWAQTSDSHRFATAAETGGLTPDQIRHAYGFDQLSFGGIQGDGTGQTIAIVDAAHSY